MNVFFFVAAKNAAQNKDDETEGMIDGHGVHCHAFSKRAYFNARCAVVFQNVWPMVTLFIISRMFTKVHRSASATNASSMNSMR